MKYLLLILCSLISYKECTIDITLPEFVYLSDHLTSEECHRLFASLHFITYDLPSTVNNAEKKVPRDIPCIKLLLRWNTGQKKWEGKRKTHMEVEHRLRQIGRIDLADWLGKAVFNNLAKSMNNTLTNTTYFQNHQIIVRNKLLKDKEFKYDNEWTAIDSILWAVLMTLLGTLLVTFCRILLLTYKKASGRHKDGEELIDLLSVASMDSDVEETIYEYQVENEADKNRTIVDDPDKIIKS
ncbi:unnamed protein product [Arctia plantaginis]|uniref:Uncharacterized protein n=1 Tax=Arctia plantaginis TaxID=874455 RepID=A0A8S0ZW66_ARCPL|nr:unnamed protein product [Arctia plantaginis]